MKLGNRTDCRYCHRDVMICRMRGGAWAPFDLDTVAASAEHPEAYLPVRTGDMVALVPVADVAPRHLEGVRWYAKRHRCAQFYAAKAAERASVDGMADVAEELIDRLTRNSAKDGEAA